MGRELNGKALIINATVYVAICNPIPKQIGKRTLASGVQEVAVSHVGKVAVFFFFNGAAVKLRGRFFFFFLKRQQKEYFCLICVHFSGCTLFSFTFFFPSCLLSVVSRSQEQELLLLLSQHWKWSVGLESARAHTR